MKAEIRNPMAEIRTGETQPRGKKALPLHVSAHHTGFRVEVRRGGSVWREYRRTLEEALAVLGEVESAAGPARYPASRPLRRVAHSNTGIVGVSETLKWVRYRPRTCFMVLAGGKYVRVHYGPRSRSRAAALRIAVGMRRGLNHRGTETQRN